MDKQKQHNRQQTSFRIKVEHKIRGIKIFNQQDKTYFFARHNYKFVLPITVFEDTAYVSHHKRSNFM